MPDTQDGRPQWPVETSVGCLPYIHVTTSTEEGRREKLLFFFLIRHLLGVGANALRHPRAFLEEKTTRTHLSHSERVVVHNPFHRFSQPASLVWDTSALAKRPSGFGMGWARRSSQTRLAATQPAPGSRVCVSERSVGGRVARTAALVSSVVYPTQVYMAPWRCDSHTTLRAAVHILESAPAYSTPRGASLAISAPARPRPSRSFSQFRHETSRSPSRLLPTRRRAVETAPRVAGPEWMQRQQRRAV
jgi:hypothetical protein